MTVACSVKMLSVAGLFAAAGDIGAGASVARFFPTAGDVVEGASFLAEAPALAFRFGGGRGMVTIYRGGGGKYKSDDLLYVNATVKMSDVNAHHVNHQNS